MKLKDKKEMEEYEKKLLEIRIKLKYLIEHGTDEPKNLLSKNLDVDLLIDLLKILKEPIIIDEVYNVLNDQDIIQFTYPYTLIKNILLPSLKKGFKADHIKNFVKFAKEYRYEITEHFNILTEEVIPALIEISSAKESFEIEKDKEDILSLVKENFNILSFDEAKKIFLREELIPLIKRTLFLNNGNYNSCKLFSIKVHEFLIKSYIYDEALFESVQTIFAALLKKTKSEDIENSFWSPKEIIEALKIINEFITDFNSFKENEIVIKNAKDDEFFYVSSRLRIEIDNFDSLLIKYVFNGLYSLVEEVKDIETLKKAREISFNIIKASQDLEIGFVFVSLIIPKWLKLDIDLDMAKDILLKKIKHDIEKNSFAELKRWLCTEFTGNIKDIKFD